MPLEILERPADEPQVAADSWIGPTPPERRSRPPAPRPALAPAHHCHAPAHLPRHGLHERSFWLALVLSCLTTGLAFGLFVIVFTLAVVPTTPDMLIIFGDSDRVGLPLGMISVEQKVYRQGDSNTVGGDNGTGPIEAPEVIPPPTPEKLPEPPKAAEPEKPEEPAPAPAPRPEPEKVPEPPKLVGPPAPPQDARPAGEEPGRVMTVGRQTPSSNLPGPPGGAPLPVGTPSQGGTLGSATGLVLLGTGEKIYPEDARQRRIQGRVLVSLRINEQGRVVEVKVQESSGYSVLDNAALAHAQSYRFAPLPHGVITTLPVSYSLR